MTRYCTFLLILSLFNIATYCQYPTNLFNNPLEIPIILAGNFGECRPNHFHTGIDLKTNQRENLKVLAAADGEVARIAISHTGYGNAVYINHNNGYMTVYAHLNEFNPVIQKYLKQQQYNQKKWAVDINIPKGTLPVKKGQFIAFSGNTGGSTSPHLHFEIRDNETQKALNPLLFGLPIKDTKPPVAKSISIYNADRFFYGNAPQLIIPLVKKDDIYTSKENVIEVSANQIQIGIDANDYMENSHNILGIYKMMLYVNDQLQLETDLTQLDFSNNRYMNAYGDYQIFKKTGKWFQGLYILKNNKLPFYNDLNENNGIIRINDSVTNVRISLKDAFGNASDVVLKLRDNGNRIADTACDFNVINHNIIKLDNAVFQYNPVDFYDDYCLQLKIKKSAGLSDVLSIANQTIPLHKYAKLKIKLNELIPFRYREKLIFVHQVKAEKLPGANPQEGMAVSYENGWAVAEIRTLGDYFVSIDTIAPEIKILLKQNTTLSNKQSISFIVNEQQTSIKSCDVYIDGEWVLASRVGNRFTYIIDEHCPKGSRTLTVVASDESGNEATKSIKFSRS